LIAGNPRLVACGPSLALTRNNDPERTPRRRFHVQL
jgi:hypothetical protein